MELIKEIKRNEDDLYDLIHNSIIYNRQDVTYTEIKNGKIPILINSTLDDLKKV